MVDFTINSKPYAGDYGGGRQMTVVLYEGTITVNSSASTSYMGTVADPGVTLGTAITKGDYLSLVRLAANEYAACRGSFAVQKAAAGSLAIGRCIDYPVWYKKPSTTYTINDTTTFAAALTAGYFRMCLAEIWCQNIHLVTAPEASTETAIVAGDAINFDCTDAGFVFLADFDVGDSDQYDSSGADTGYLGLMAAGNSLNSANADGEYILLAVGLRPISFVTGS